MKTRRLFTILFIIASTLSLAMHCEPMDRGYEPIPELDHIQLSATVLPEQSSYHVGDTLWFFAKITPADLDNWNRFSDAEYSFNVWLISEEGDYPTQVKHPDVRGGFNNEKTMFELKQAWVITAPGKYAFSADFNDATCRNSMETDTCGVYVDVRLRTRDYSFGEQLPVVFTNNNKQKFVFTAVE